MNNSQGYPTGPGMGYGFVPPESSPPSYDAATSMTKQPHVTVGVPQPTIFIGGPPTASPGNNFYQPSQPQQPIVAQPTTNHFQPAMSTIGPDPGNIRCPGCNKDILTKLETLPGLMSYAAGAILCVSGCMCGCCLIPCWLEDCKDVAHYCPECKAFLGRYRRHLGCLRLRRNRSRARRSRT